MFASSFLQNEINTHCPIAPNFHSTPIKNVTEDPCSLKRCVETQIWFSAELVSFLRSNEKSKTAEEYDWAVGLK